MNLAALKPDSRFAKWGALIILEIAIGIYSIVLPSKTAVLLLFMVPAGILMLANYLYAYLLGIFLLPVWTFTLTGQTEVAGQIDFRFSDACFLLAALGWIGDGVIRHRLSFRRSLIDFWLFVFLFWILLSISWSPSVAGGIKEFLRKLNGVFIFYLTINIVKREKDLHLAVTAWIVAGTYTAAFALYEVFSEILFRVAGISKAHVERWGWLRASALKEGANRLGYLMNTSIMLTISRYFLAEKKGRRVLLMIVMIMMVMALMSTLSRNSVMGCVVGATVLFYLAKKGGKKFFVTAAIVGVLFLIFSGPAYRDVFLKRILGIIQFEVTRSIEERTLIWETATRIVADRPFGGAGAGGFHVISESFGAGKLKSPHNLYMYITAEFGIIGFMLFAGFVVAFLMLAKTGRQSLSGEKERLVSAALFAGIVVYGFQGLVVNFVLIEREFWALLGLNVAALRVYSTRVST